MTRSLSFGALAALTASFGSIGCGSDAAEPAEAQSRIDIILPALVDSTSSAMAKAEGIPSLGWLGESLSAMNTAFPVLGGGDDDDFVQPFAFDMAELDEESPGAAMAFLLKELVFNEQSYEGNGYYRLRGEVVCGSGAPDCAAEVARAEIRFHVVLAEDDGLDISLAIGPQRAEPLALELRPNRLSIVLDLAAAKAAIGHLAGDTAELPQLMEGVLALSLIVHGQDDVSVETAVRKALRVDAALPGMDAPFRFSTAAKDPVVALRFNGAASELRFDLDLGRTDLSMPWGLSSSSGVGEIFAMSLGGMSASTTLRADATSAVITNIGLGDGTTTIKVDDHTLLAIDLNAGANRRFDLTIRPDDAGLPILAFSPGFDLSLAFDLRPLANAGEEVESHLLDETYRIALTGDAPAIQPIEASFENDYQGGLRVSAGTLEISSTGAEAAVVVEAGMCLIAVEAELELEAHPVIGALSAADCSN